MNPFHNLKPLKLTALILLYLFFLLVVFFQARLDSIGSLCGGHPDLPLAVLVLLSLHFHRSQAALTCGFLGLMRGAFSQEAPFFFILLFLAIGMGVAYGKRFLRWEHIFSNFILVFSAAVVFYLSLAVKSWMEFSFPPLGRGILQSLISSIYTGVLGCLLVQFFLRLRKKF